MQLKELVKVFVICGLKSRQLKSSAKFKIVLDPSRPVQRKQHLYSFPVHEYCVLRVSTLVPFVFYYDAVYDDCTL